MLLSQKMALLTLIHSVHPHCFYKKESWHKNRRLQPVQLNWSRHEKRPFITVISVGSELQTSHHTLFPSELSFLSFVVPFFLCPIESSSSLTSLRFIYNHLLSHFHLLRSHSQPRISTFLDFIPHTESFISVYSLTQRPILFPLLLPNLPLSILLCLDKKETVLLPW